MFLLPIFLNFRMASVFCNLQARHTFCTWGYYTVSPLKNECSTHSEAFGCILFRPPQCFFYDPLIQIICCYIAENYETKEQVRLGLQKIYSHEAGGEGGNRIDPSFFMGPYLSSNSVCFFFSLFIINAPLFLVLHNIFRLQNILAKVIRTTLVRTTPQKLRYEVFQNCGGRYPLRQEHMDLEDVILNQYDIK